MSLLAAKVPEVLVKRGKMFSMWSSKLKLVWFAVALALYIYVLVCLKTAYMRGQRLDNIEDLASKNEKLIKLIHGLDEQLAGSVNRLNDIYEDY